MEKYINERFKELKDVQERFIRENKQIIADMAKEIANCYINGGKVMIFGNGGSAADAQHIAAEFINRFKMERPPLPCIALTTDTSVITSIGNDYEFNDIFSKQISALGNPIDIAWGISTSGNSENVLKALRIAAKNGLKTIGFTGNSGGKMPGICDYSLIVPSRTTARIQELHIFSAHMICELVDEIMFGQFMSELH
jgi:D-sedoheptulose 7-phosphate isomerase